MFVLTEIEEGSERERDMMSRTFTHSNKSAAARYIRYAAVACLPINTRHVQLLCREAHRMIQYY